MLLVGNDIVDLTLPENMGRSRDQRFLDRVFTPDEQDLIRRAAFPDRVLWGLWAVKESAYKICRKLDPDAPFLPRRCQVRLHNPAGGATSPDEGMTSALPGELPQRVPGQVHTTAGEIRFILYLNSQYVHSVGVLNAGEGDTILRQKISCLGSAEQHPDEASFHVRQMARRHLALCLGKNPSDIHIRRAKSPAGLSPPRVHINHVTAPLVDISLSHDGRYIAHAFAIDQPTPEATDRQQLKLRSPLMDGDMS